ncbi:MAG: TonB-dependent receptor [Bacteroidales bacterium]|nr:TonB-dependent receptor [Bacteroidales bacterium]MBN2820975.1 TonB-dependent receptor [Bacteroidales bacterium]
MRFLTAIAFALLSVSVFAQNTAIKGVVKDAVTGETIIGANVLYAENKGTVTDINGNFSFELSPGSYEIQVSYVGYETIRQTITLTAKSVYLSFELQSLTIDEVIIVADVALNRETPVAFTNVSPQRIEEELAGQDLPMILNTTPGVYATQQGGGDGDARITIRGFDQTNLAVMIDGIPVNDMENGWVYWSNWFGLDQVTRMTQVQRGLGASQLALPSVGGTINILTKGVEDNKETAISQTVDGQGKIRTSLGFTSGEIGKGWGITLAGSYKRGNGWVDNTFSEGWFYYGKLDKRINKHLLSVTAMGAPQHHDQRSYTLPIAAYDSKMAKKLGIDLEALDTASDNFHLINLGRTYNQHWGTLKRDRYDSTASEETLSERSNIYHKPQFTLRDFWTVSNKLTISTSLYLSIGKGGGDGPRSSMKTTNLIQDENNPDYGQINWQAIYNVNCKPSNTGFGWVYPINTKYNDSLYMSSNYMTRQHNEHYWYGALAKFNFVASNSLKLSGGLDLRSYRGIHYRTVTDLLGGDYAVDLTDERVDYNSSPLRAMKYKGDTIQYYYEGLVKWSGVFFQAEKDFGRIKTFLNLTSALNAYKKIDYYTQSESDWIWKPGMTVKTGGNFNIDNTSQVFMNLGYLSKVRAFKYYYQGYTTSFQENTDNEIIKAIEGGYNFHSRTFSLRFNAYYTLWQNKPPDNQIRSTYVLQAGETGYIEGEPEQNEVDVYADIPGMNARHMGVETDFIVMFTKNIEFQGTISFGDWIWDSKVEGLQYYHSLTNEAVNKTVDFDARGIHVGNAAQTQLGSSIKYKPFKGYYLTLRQTYFGKYYSEFSPEATTDAEGNVVDSWKMPEFNLFDIHTGYSFPVSEAVRGSLNLSVLNLLDTSYIWDATNNDSYGPYSNYKDFDAKSATVFFGLGRRYSFTFKITF